MSERNGYQAGVPCWVDTWQADGAAAAAFYGELFGWQVLEPTGGHAMCCLGGKDVAGIGSPAPDGVPPAWTTYVWVDDADATARTVVDAGGAVRIEPFDSLDGGRMAIVADPAGATFGLWQPREHQGAQVVNEPSAWAMSLLQTPDPEGAKRFYGAVFGWQTEAFGPATMWRLPGYFGGEPEQPVPRDVVAVMVESEAPATWRPDFWVADAEAAVAKAEERGGSVLSPVQPSPVGKAAVLADPTGAVFSINEVVMS